MIVIDVATSDIPTVLLFSNNPEWEGVRVSGSNGPVRTTFRKIDMMIDLPGVSRIFVDADLLNLTPAYQSFGLHTGLKFADATNIFTEFACLQSVPKQKWLRALAAMYYLLPLLRPIRLISDEDPRKDLFAVTPASEATVQDYVSNPYLCQQILQLDCLLLDAANYTIFVLSEQHANAAINIIRTSVSLL